MVILGIETSCDETAAAVVVGQKGQIKVLSNIISSQINLHQKYGGVVPEVAAREHLLKILPVINEALEEAELTLPPLNLPLSKGENKRGWRGDKIPLTPFTKGGKKIDAITVTIGPGLITSLLVGVETAKTLSYVWQIPLLAINHIEAHLYANFIKQLPKLPAIILTVSGGHTMLILMKDHNQYQVLGETRDDAAGEAFDKAAKLLGLGYPGGPAIAAEAAKCRMSPRPELGTKANVECRINKLPRPMIKDKNFDFSFSGLKTALFYQLKKDKDWRKKISQYAAEFQQAVVEVLVAKTIKAALTFGIKSVMLAGGVAANQLLRSQLTQAVKNKLGVDLIVPDLAYCTDNAAMVATAGYWRAKKKDFTPWQKIRVDANLELK